MTTTHPNTKSTIDIKSIPYLILRDSCKCKKCYISKTKERKHKLENFDFSVRPIEYLPYDNGNWSITWSDGHLSKYSADDLQNIKNFSTETLNKVCWKRSFSIPCHDYISAKNNPDKFKGILEDLLIFGITKIENTPISPGFVEKFAYEISCVREIVFDRVADIVVKDDAYTQGFTPVDLPLHTDCSGYR